MAAVAEFKNQDWVQDILQASSNSTKEKAYVDPNVAFPFQDNFLVGTIHGANAKNNKSTPQQAAGDDDDNEGVIEILDNEEDNDVSILTSKTQDELVALLVQARKQLSSTSIGSRVASSSNPPLGSELPCNPNPTWVVRSPPLPTVPLQAPRAIALEGMQATGRAANRRIQRPP
jgi:hypothetical protein